ncbi:MAG: formylglycine-generating enzyme family protein [Treponema sp.]|jgi:formylglycine-generating enzyme required for sulfatase activity|nr:formylglycine-generating enzyme family protein [Treponema sp.]
MKKLIFRMMTVCTVAVVIVTMALLFAGCSDSTGNPKGQYNPKDQDNPNTPGGDEGSSAVTEITSDTGIVLIKITAGTFSMGQAYYVIPVHSVTLTSGFYMGKYQVTQEQYKAVMENSNPSSFTTAVEGESGTPDKLPVETVSWYDTLVFCNKLSIAEGLSPAYKISGSTDPADWGSAPTESDPAWDAVEIVTDSNGYRLPTEAQWEYACRAGTTTAFNNGNDNYDTVGAIAWYKDNSSSKTHKVGLKTANAWGLYDMHGNLAEWCWDRYGGYSGSAQTDPVGPSSGAPRVIRGGGWNGSAQGVGSAFRFIEYPISRKNNLGFRLLRPNN